MTIDNRFFFPGQSSLQFGQKLEPQYSLRSKDGESTKTSWNNDKEAEKRLFHATPGVYRARDLIAMYTPLVDTCIVQVGPDQPEAMRDILVNGLAAILATSGRESSLPISTEGNTGKASDRTRIEMAHQADKIGATLVQYARESVDYKTANPHFAMRSYCDGETWSRDAVRHLTGVRGGRVVMQLYNEWVHRIVLLRNALMPFENWDEVPIVIDNDRRGIRMLQEPSNAFVMRLLSGQLPQNAIVDMAKALTAPKLPSGGFGFQYSQGTILPAFLGGSVSRSLLRYYPTHGTDSEADVLFRYEHASYDDAPQNDLPVSATKHSYDTATARRVASALKSYRVQNTDGLRTHLKLDIQLENRPDVFSICVGQIARGRRFASHVLDGESQEAHDVKDAVFHSVEEALAVPDLVFSASEDETSEKTLHVFPTTDPVLGLALFGKLYPGNVVALHKTDNLASALTVGRGFGTKFVLWQRKSI